MRNWQKLVLGVVLAVASIVAYTAFSQTPDECLRRCDRQDWSTPPLGKEECVKRQECLEDCFQAHVDLDTSGKEYGKTRDSRGAACAAFERGPSREECESACMAYRSRASEIDCTRVCRELEPKVPAEPCGECIVSNCMHAFLGGATPDYVVDQGKFQACQAQCMKFDDGTCHDGVQQADERKRQIAIAEGAVSNSREWSTCVVDCSNAVPRVRDESVHAFLCPRFCQARFGKDEVQRFLDSIE